MNITHRKSSSDLYKKWAGMKRRCLNKNEIQYHNYGGRGIKVCDKWLKFEGFAEDMESTFKKGLSLERIDVNGNYCKENCKWIPLSEQSRNRRNVILREYKGKNDTLKYWAKKLGYSYEPFRRKFKRRNISIAEYIKEFKHRKRGYYPRNGRYLSRVWFKKNVTLGTFDTKEEAIALKNKAEEMKKQGYTLTEIKTKLCPNARKLD